VDAVSFKALKDRFGPFSVDLFANEINHKVPKFYANFFAPSAAGIEAFGQDWAGECAWVCPPVKYIIRTIRKIKQDKLSGVLVVPDWKSARHLTFVQDANGGLVWPFQE
jgi:hypothetical protein